MNTSTIEEYWKRGKCRTEDGVFFPSGKVLLFSGNDYTIVSETTIEALMVESPESWFEYDQLFEKEMNNYHIQGGSGPMEGEGWLAASLLPDEKLIWILHLNASEAFTSADIKHNTIIAISEEYPTKKEWVIPIDHPELLTVKEKKEN